MKIKILIMLLMASIFVYGYDLKKAVNEIVDPGTEIRINAEKVIKHEAENNNKEVIDLLINNLVETKDKYKQFKIEALLYYLTEYNCFGVCIGNNEGAKEWQKWWSDNKSKFEFPKWSPGYYYYYYGNHVFVDNFKIYYWKNAAKYINNLNFSENNKTNSEDKIFIEKLINNLDYETDEISLVFAFQVLDSYGKNIIPLVIEKMYVENRAENNHWFRNMELFQEITGVNLWNKNGNTPPDFKKLQDEAIKWWGTESKAFVFKKDPNNYAKMEIIKKKVNIPVNKEDEKVIKDLINDYTSNDHSKIGNAFSKLSNDYGRNATSILFNEYLISGGERAKKIESILLGLYILESPRFKGKDSPEERKKKWTEWYKKKFEKQ